MTTAEARTLETASADGLAALLDAFRRECEDFTTFEDDETVLYRQERKYKDELTALFQEQVTPLVADFSGGRAESRDLVEAIRRVLVTRLEASRKPQNLINWRYFDFLTRLTDADAEGLATAVRDLLRGENDAASRVQAFNDVVWPMMQAAGVTGPAASRSFCTILLMLDDPSEHIYVRTRHIETCYRLLYGGDIFENSPLSAEEYRRVQRLAQDLREALVEAGYQPKDMIDVQSFIWRAVPGLGSGAGGNGGGQPKGPARSFEQITRSLAARGLYFPAEVVANYLLALQAKRFVILTGISGTGKTKLALAVAEHYQPTVVTERPVEVPEDAIEVSVKPYMRKYHRIMIPVALASQLLLTPSDAGESTEMKVRYPEGETTLSYWWDADRNVTALLFRGAFRQWFSAQFEEGDSFELAVAAFDDDEVPTGLVFNVLETRQSKEKLPNQEVVAVRPDWTDKNGLLGYYNPITQRYARTPFLDLLLRAAKEMQSAEAEDREPRPFFVVLDEMNLARVEHYFSDFLSCMESGKAIHLHSSDTIESGELTDEDPVPMKLGVPRNVFFTGTVNVDETTYMFSPKVLDRAFTIELNEVDLDALGRTNVATEGVPTTPLALTSLPSDLEQLSPPGTDDWLEFGKREAGELARRVTALNDLLAQHDRHFGYRVAVEIARFVNLAAQQAGEEEPVLWAALDLAIMQKVLPKIHGTQQELEDLLEELRRFAGGAPLADRATEVDGMETTDTTPEAVVTASTMSSEPTLPRVVAKLERMLARLRRQGFTAFIE